MAIIQEKGLVRAIKDAYRHGGYNVLNLDGDVVIYITRSSGACASNKKRGTYSRRNTARKWQSGNTRII